MRSATYEVRQKEALDWPLATASVVLRMNGNVVASAKIVLGHVAPKPWDSADAAKALAGKAITAETAEAAGKAAVAGAKPLSQNAYKVHPGPRGGETRAAGGRETEGITMERPGLTKVSMNRCEKLRWKGMFIEAEWDPTIQHSQRPRLLVPAHLELSRPGRQDRRRVRVQSGRNCYEQL